MPTEVLITGVGVVSPIGIGVDEVWHAIQDRKSGVHPVAELEAAGWPAPFGGWVENFDPKAHVKPRKSLKIMSRETQMAFAAGEAAWADARLDKTEVDPERVGVIGAAGLQYCPLEELVDPMAASCDAKGRADLVRWGEEGIGRLFPLWMLKYLPNMAACHVGIRRDARGPTNTISNGAVSSLLALGEAYETIRRGAADVMLAGGTSSQINLPYLLWHGAAGMSSRTEDPAGACRPFDAERDGAVAAEGAAYFVLESREHAQRRRGDQIARPWAKIEGAASRYDSGSRSTGNAITQAAAAVLAESSFPADRLAMVKAHGTSRPDTDTVEAQALEPVIGRTPVTAPTSYFGSAGAAGGALELAMALIAWREGIVPATLNFKSSDPECPVNVAAEHRPAEGETLLAVNHNPTGQAVAALLSAAADG